MAKKTYRVSSDEFKREALELVENSDKNVAQIERDPGISSGLLYKWRDRYQVSDEDNDSVIARSEMKPLKAELHELKQENTVLRQERDILKNSTHLLAGRPAMKYEIIETHRMAYPVSRLCEVLEVVRVTMPGVTGNPLSASVRIRN